MYVLPYPPPPRFPPYVAPLVEENGASLSACIPYQVSVGEENKKLSFKNNIFLLSWSDVFFGSNDIHYLV